MGGVELALIAGAIWLWNQARKKDESDTPDATDGTDTVPPPSTATPTPTTPTVPSGPSGVAPTAPTPSGTWDTTVWGGKGQPMKWVAIRSAIAIAGWPFADGLVDRDVNGINCPPVGSASRANCTRSSQVAAFQRAYNSLVRSANKGQLFRGSDLFKGKGVIGLDGVLGPQTLRALSVQLGWQNEHGGSVFGSGNFKRLAELRGQ